MAPIAVRAPLRNPANCSVTEALSPGDEFVLVARVASEMGLPDLAASMQRRADALASGSTLGDLAASGDQGVALALQNSKAPRRLERPGP